MWRIAFIMVFFIAVNAYAQSSEKFKIIKTNEFEGAIIPKEQVPQLKYFDEKREAYWTPTKQDILEAEKLSKNYLEKYNGDDKYIKTSIATILSRLGQYKRQYVGLIEKNGNKTIWINYFYDNGSFSNWDKSLVFVLDGGNSFFNIKANLNKKQCYDLRINGVA